jgi:hypothetical protein
VNRRDLLTQLSVGRLALGASLVVRPQLVGGLWLGADARRPAVGVLGRAFGARDAALGGGTLTAMRAGQPLLPWLVAGLVADGTDLLATFVARDKLPRRALPLIGPLAGFAVAVGAANLASVEDSPEA